MTCTLPRQGLYALSAIPVQKALAGTVLCTSRAYARDTSRVLCTTVPYPCKRRFPVRFRVLTGLTHATLRADCGSCVLARLMHATLRYATEVQSLFGVRVHGSEGSPQRVPRHLK